MTRTGTFLFAAALGAVFALGVVVGFVADIVATVAERLAA